MQKCPAIRSIQPLYIKIRRMKSILIVLFYSLLAVASYARPATCIQGKFTTKSPGKLMLFSFQSGRQALITSVKTQEDGSFKIVFTPRYEGFYLIGKNEKIWYPLYIKGGEQVNIRILESQALLQGENTPENKALYQWETCAAPVRLHAFLYERIRGENSVEPPVFFRLLENLVKEKEKLLRQTLSGNKRFNKLWKEKIRYDLDFYALAYCLSQGNNIPDTLVYPEYYRLMQPDRLFQHPGILDIPGTAEMLDTYIGYVRKSDTLTTNSLQQNVAYLHHKALQQEYLLIQAGKFKYYDQYQKMLADLDKSMLTPSLLKKLEKITGKLNWSKPGNPAPDFQGLTPEEHLLALSDFRGKVVVVDVWATWCDPCLKMLPYFQQLEQEMKGPEVAFLSVCMGANIEKAAWLRLIQQKQLKGNLIFIGNWKGDFATNYKITGVPRYMIFDRQGRIVSVAAPPPTSPELKEIIRKQLKKK